ncbi:MAG: hypothetical protein WAV00_06550 [Nocardioides sp.]
MSAGWVGVSVRGRAMTNRRVGRVAARGLAARSSLDDALTALAHTSYGHALRGASDLETAQRAVVEATLWNVRVLAGWAPRQGVAILRALAAVLEAANIRDHLRLLEGTTIPSPYRLGGLSTAWPRVAVTGSVEEVRSVLTTSPWGDPAGGAPHDIALMLQTSLSDRVIAAVPEAAAWASGATALLVAREVVRDRRDLPAAARRSAARVLGDRGLRAGSVPELAGLVPAQARWALTEVHEPAGLWEAEGRWWGRVERDAFALVRRPTSGPEVLVGAVALLAVDTWRVRAALELAARGGGPMEVFDAVA